MTVLAMLMLFVSFLGAMGLFFCAMFYAAMNKAEQAAFDRISRWMAAWALASFIAGGVAIWVQP